MMDDAVLQAVCDECVPLIRAMGRGRCAISMGGSRGKRLADTRSDIDFRLFCDETVGTPYTDSSPTWAPFVAAVERWRAQGINIDYVWVRTVADIDAQVAAWLNGDVPKVDYVWTVWGYHVLTDITNQAIIDDPHGLIAHWQKQLTPYPAMLKTAVLKKYAESLTYWRSDYHYRHKVMRGDAVFLASITPRLINDIMQILYAYNEVYYIGDGNNLTVAAKFATQPAQLTERVTQALYPAPGPDCYERQYQTVLALIDDVLALVPAVERPW